mgnify:CR=1 FL=1
MKYVVYVCDLSGMPFIKPGKLYQLENDGSDREYFIDEDGDCLGLDYDTTVISIP